MDVAGIVWSSRAYDHLHRLSSAKGVQIRNNELEECESKGYKGMKLHCITCSMIGPKRRNEDAILTKIYDDCDKALFMVCDGMSGLHMGDVVSQTVTDTFSSVWDTNHKDWITEKMLHEAVKMAKARIDSLSKYDVGTTMVMAAADGDTLTIAHLGDSRGYYVRPDEGVLYQTEDHITIGQEGWPYVSKGFFNFRDVDEPTTRTFLSKSGDRILLCSDGVYDCYRKTALTDLLQEDMEITTMMSNIVGYCDEYAHDNFSAILIEID